MKKMLRVVRIGMRNTIQIVRSFKTVSKQFLFDLHTMDLLLLLQREIKEWLMKAMTSQQVMGKKSPGQT
ncbi:hypothetical protein ATANTOWER_026419 [Ataeniobius toweri]|uniref:Uncharacterized protein n=1 Tax=Ataeniobius toweri TaxID=208326 RepID=A0ABU7BXZ7_9TELE|nr:hypothetical protein [Ataeniobius toweri]